MAEVNRPSQGSLECLSQGIEREGNAEESIWELLEERILFLLELQILIHHLLLLLQRHH